MNGSGSVLGQVLSNIQLSLDYIGIIRWNEAFRSYCDLLCWILISITSPTFSTFSISNIFVACVCNLDLPMLSRFSSLSTFSCQICLLFKPCLCLAFSDFLYGSKQSFSFTYRWTKEKETV